MTGGVRCPHADHACPCNDGDPCNYETVTLTDGTVSEGAPCRNVWCPTCTPASAGVAS